MVRHVIPDPRKRLRQHAGSDDIVREDGLRMDHRSVHAFLDVDDSVIEGDPLNLAEFFTAPLMQRFAPAELGLLRREAIAVHRSSGSAPDRSHERQACEACPLLEEVLLGQGRQSEIFPPGRLLLAPMPVEHIGQDPAGVLLCRALAGIRRHIGSQARNEFGDSGLPRATDLAHLPRGRYRALDHRAVGDQVGSNALEPVPKRTSGEAVIPVVARDGILECGSDRLRVADLE